MSDTPETDAAWEELCSNFSRYRIAEKMKAYCQEKERERDEARDMVEKLTEQGLDLMDENRMLKRQVKEIKNTIRETLEENRHLADGDNCTLKKLKLAIPDWE